jgi:SAM-dependent methyltransferase
MDLQEEALNPSHRHPWEISRAENLLIALAPVKAGERVVDVGAGDGYFAEILAARTGAEVWAVDARYVSSRASTSMACSASTREVPTAWGQKAVAMDVLEHVADDAAFLLELGRLLGPGGTLLVTVPAHPRLFSPHDEALGHFRRYSREALLDLFAGDQWEVQAWWGFFLIPLLVRSVRMLLPKEIQRRRYPGEVARWRYGPSSLITRLALTALSADFRFSRWLSQCTGLATGLSICAILRRR